MNYVVEAVRKEFEVNRQKVAALESISLLVAGGEQMAILGSSGAGKTTLFRILNGTLRPTSGSVCADGRNLASMSSGELRRTRRRIGTVYQQHNLVPSLSALQNALCGGLGRWSAAQTIRNILQPAKSDAEGAIHALDLVGLAGKRHARADELSGGQQQRLALARVLVQKPDVILADEPVASLDPTLAEDMVRLLQRVSEEGRCTLVMALHKVELALEYFPRVVGLRAGSVSFDRAAGEVRDEVLRDLYSNVTGNIPQVQDENRFTRELGCSR